MNRIGTFILSFLLLTALTSAAIAVEQNIQPSSTASEAIPIESGGTYCAGATVIDSSTTNYSDTGILDQDNDCSNPFPWPYNDIFYRFRPSESRIYIFRFQLPAFGQKAAIRIMANACCSGGITVAADTNNVAQSCDSGATAYVRAHLSADSTYWIHLGNMSPTPSHAAYRFQMMYVPCPTSESTTPHQTPGTAQEIALNDSIMGDSATFAHPKWFKFTLNTADSVIIQEFGRTFGHCNAGFYPQCLINPLDAHFTVYCDTFGHQLGEGHNGMCSNDAVIALCLPAGTYYIQVANFEGSSWAGWTFILSLTTRPAGNCPPLQITCGQEQFLCPTGFDSLVTLTPLGTPPGPQHVEACVRLDTTHMTTLVVPVQNVHNRPTVTVSTQCSTCTATGCTPLTGGWTFNPDSWVFHDSPPRFTNTIIANPGALGCCVCVTLDFVLPVELQSFTAIAGDGEVTLHWATASENNNDHFEIERDGVVMARVQGAGSSSSAHTYDYTDQSLTNRQTYTYRLMAVDGQGSRSALGTLHAVPVGSAPLVTEYALRQNYPNPFNPTTQISFDLVEAGNASLSIYNLMGQQVVTLVNGNLSAGRHEVSFDATNLPSGIYLYRLKVNGFVAEKKMLLMK
ncbi:MAG TPA: T9SS type A sorting domain-containing protein [bacterium]|jgi:hypothetical protein